MPFEFVCPYCHCKTKVLDRYAGQSGPCVDCGKTVTMPHFNASGVLVPSIASTKKPGYSQTTRQRGWMPALVGAAVITTLLLIGGLVLAVAWPSVTNGFRRAAQSRDLQNMETIAQALNAYSDRYGTYPPPVVLDANGTPLYSWRVLILPFMGNEGLYKRFELSKPWNSPANQSLLNQMPSEFASSNSPDAAGIYETNYVLLTGPGTLFPPSGPLSRTQAEKNTILLVETNNMCSWTQPGDINIGRGLRVGQKPMVDVGGLHQGSFTAITTDEDGLRIPSDVPQAVLDALVTPDGGENVDVSTFTE
jgi:type II secretory pathway pseudopilin PulG